MSAQVRRPPAQLGLSAAAEARAKELWHELLVDGHELWWWHRAVLREVARLQLDHGQAAANHAQLAGNVRGFLAMDTESYCRQLVAAGGLEEAEAAWPTERSYLWVRLPRS